MLDQVLVSEIATRLETAEFYLEVVRRTDAQRIELLKFNARVAGQTLGSDITIALRDLGNIRVILIAVIARTAGETTPPKAKSTRDLGPISAKEVATWVAADDAARPEADPPHSH